MTLRSGWAPAKLGDGRGVGRVGAACPEDSVAWLASGLAAPGSPARDRFYRTVAALGAQAAQALDFAHRRNIVHRDIKPENLLICEEDGALRLRVTDFGFSAPEEGQADASDGVLMGTPSYMSPEQAIGLDVDRRGDIYSLGAVLYELATLTPVVRRGTLPEMIRQIALGKVLPPRAIDPALPGARADHHDGALAGTRGPVRHRARARRGAGAVLLRRADPREEALAPAEGPAARRPPLASRALRLLHRLLSDLLRAQCPRHAPP